MQLSKPFLGLDLANAKIPPKIGTFLKSPTVLKLASGLLVMETDLDVDCDGRWPHRNQDPDAQSDTSLHEADGRALDASLTPFFVLPKWFGDAHGVKLGDYAAIVWRSKLIFAILADYGPSKKLGEASLRVHEALGNDNFVNGDYLNSGIDAGVQTLVFPGSGDGSVPSDSAIQTKGRALLDKARALPRLRVGLFGRADQWGDELGESVVLDSGKRRVPLRQFVAWVLQTPPSQVPITWDGATKTATLEGVKLKSAKRVGENPVTALVAELMEVLGKTPDPGADEFFVLYR